MGRAGSIALVFIGKVVFKFIAMYIEGGELRGAVHFSKIGSALLLLCTAHILGSFEAIFVDS